jgi:hypothetical protein
MSKITNAEVLRRVQEMLKKEWNAILEPTDTLDKQPETIQALLEPIRYRFQDVGAVVKLTDLGTQKKVVDLSDLIWLKIPESNKA